MKTYTIEEFKNEINWDMIEPLTIDEFPWYTSGLKQNTFVKIALKDHVLYLKVKAIDCHSSAEILEENGSVYLDSCFEFFLTPEHKLSESYINFEINCVGNLYLAVRCDKGKRRGNSEEIAQVKIQSSLPYKRVKEASDQDDYWTLDIQIPLAFLEEFYGKKIDSDYWYGNFYRIGGRTDDQYGCWQPLVCEKPNFHLPLQFGRIALKKQAK